MNRQTLCLASRMAITFLLTGLAASGAFANANQAKPTGPALHLTVSVPPLAGLLKPLLSEGDRITVLLKPGVSPHGFQLKPSHLRAIDSSDAVFAIGTPVDGWLEKTLSRVGKPVLKMSEVPGLQTRPIRNGGLWLKADSGTEEDHRDHHDHAHAHMDEGDKAYLKKTKKWHYDGHIWLSMTNAQLFVESAAELIKQLKPQQADVIEQNKQAWLAKLTQLDQTLAAKLAPVKDTPFVVLHDAYQYFEAQYGLNGVGSVRLNPEIAPSLKRVQQLRERIEQRDIACIFKEPQFPEKRILAVVRGLDVGIGQLDPMGSFQPGQAAPVLVDGFLTYDVFLEEMAHAFLRCLQPAQVNMKTP